MSLLDVDLALRRSSTLVWIACALAVAGAAIHQFAVQPLNTRIEERGREAARVKQAGADSRVSRAPQVSLIEARLAAFNGTLGDKSKLTSFLNAVFEQAAKHDLTLAQAEYKLELDKAGGFHTYQMTLPVRGPYPRLRGFVDATLAQVPCAALEDVDFKRDAIGATEAEARLRFVFFLKQERS